MKYAKQLLNFRKYDIRLKVNGVLQIIEQEEVYKLAIRAISGNSELPGIRISATYGLEKSKFHSTKLVTKPIVMQLEGPTNVHPECSWTTSLYVTTDELSNVLKSVLYEINNTYSVKREVDSLVDYNIGIYDNTQLVIFFGKDGLNYYWDHCSRY